LKRIDLRASLATAAVIAALSLSACTTTEGTNAMSDVTTFEREVMTETLKGVGMIPREEKPELAQHRAPLVLPRDNQNLPAPSTAVAALPEDSDTVQIDASNLTEEDLRLLRNARVVDLRTVSGRPLTETEAMQFTARMISAKKYTGARPLLLPPDEYFTVSAQGNTLVCLAKNGDLVSINDPACPDEIRRALQNQ
jgi:hypothetical protein